MSENIVEKTLTVTTVAITTELATGSVAYQVILGSIEKTTPEILSRIPANQREPFLATKNIAVNQITMILDVDEVPYKVGSKWKVKIRKNGTLNLVQEK